MVVAGRQGVSPLKASLEGRTVFAWLDRRLFVRHELRVELYSAVVILAYLVILVKPF